MIKNSKLSNILDKHIELKFNKTDLNHSFKERFYMNDVIITPSVVNSVETFLICKRCESPRRDVIGVS